MAAGSDRLIEVPTRLGPVQFRGVDTGRPILLFIMGAFATENTVDRVHERFPALDVLRAHLPGNHCPRIAEVSVQGFAAAFTEALETRFLDRPLVIVGLSVGALVAMSIRVAGLAGLVLVEPPLVTDEAWPLRLLRTQAPAGNDDFVWNIFGVGPERIERRDYRPQFGDMRTPATIVLGEPVPPDGQATEQMPGLVGPLSRAAIQMNPAARTVQYSNVGHHIIRHKGMELLYEIQSTVRVCLGEDLSVVYLPELP